MRDEVGGRNTGSVCLDFVAHNESLLFSATP